ncbi:MAG TPA: RodZ domain-containing protein [Terriglobales bacterium]|nr:RodZ domain-containing protein [Terriglobales bacterium]
MARGTFGERLKRERELREVTLEEVSKATRISQRFLQALENEDWQKLPGGVFGRGFVRTTARYLGLDEENLLAEYDLVRGDQLSSTPSRPEERIPSPPKWIPVALALALILIVAGLIFGGIYGWRLYQAHRNSKKSAILPKLTPNPQSSTDAKRAEIQRPGAANVAALQDSPLDLSVSASSPVHLNVQADGAMVFDGQFSADETRHFRAQDRFTVTASDSSAVLLELNGQAMPPLGEPGASGTITLSRRDLKQEPGGNSQP